MQKEKKNKKKNKKKEFYHDKVKHKIHLTFRNNK